MSPSKFCSENTAGTGRSVFLNLDYCSNGDLFSLVKNHGRLPKSVADTLFMQIVDAVEFMHRDAELTHLDLKLENVLLDGDFKVKLCDFGFCQSNSSRLFKGVGTEGYKAPEIFKL